LQLLQLPQVLQLSFVDKTDKIVKIIASEFLFMVQFEFCAVQLGHEQELFSLFKIANKIGSNALLNKVTSVNIS
jgi:hypothetical protein